MSQATTSKPPKRGASTKSQSAAAASKTNGPAVPSAFNLSEVVPRFADQEAALTRNCLHDDLTPPLAPPKSLKLRGIVLVDMDNTLNDWDAQFRRLMSIFYPDIQLVEPEQRLQYHIELNYPEHVREATKSLTQLRGFWATMPVAKGAAAALSSMQACGLQVWILSQPDDRFTGRCSAEKYEWLETNFGAQWKSRLILTADKTLVTGDVLIDDKPEITGSREPEWTRIKYCQPYNQKTNAQCIHSWDRWYETLGPILKEGL